MHDGVWEPAETEVMRRLVRRVYRRGRRGTALGARRGTGELDLSRSNQGDHRLVASANRKSVEVMIERLDTLLAGREPTVIKIDTKGSEFAILRGAEATFARVHPPSRY